MGKVYDEIDDSIQKFIESQHVFFVATAPLAGDGLVNLSPKGLDALRVLGPREVAYLDLTGSGIETVAHLKENGRICFMFCAFDGAPRIVRLHADGEVLEPGHADFERLQPLFPPLPGARSIVRASVTRIADSCGWGVPRYEFQEPRDQLVRFAEQLGPEKIRRAQIGINARSLDGLPGVSVAEDSGA